MNVKPRFRLKGGIWSCVTWWITHRGDFICFRAGYGNTQQEAYEDWKAQPSAT